MTPGSVRLFRSNAHYWDPRGPISWDMAMQGTSPDWRPYVKAGDTLSVSATYETRRASWYESMGIMVVWEAWDKAKGATDPFSHKLDQSGHLTHGHLAENDHHGGTLQVGQNPNTMPDCTADQVTIRHYQYNPGGFFATGKNDCIPTIRQGQTVTFVNQDAPQFEHRVPQSQLVVRQGDLPHGHLVPEPVRARHRHLLPIGPGRRGI